jgi:hypothetical protein
MITIDGLKTSRLLGKEVLIDYSRASKMKVSPEFEALQAPELVASTQEWMTAFFGYTWTIPTGTIHTSNYAMAMNPDTYQQLKQKLRRADEFR